MKEYVKKIFAVFRGSALKSVWRWSKPVRVDVALICLASMLATLCSLSITLVTKGMIDGATSSDVSALWKYGALLVALLFAVRAFSVLSALIRNRASATLQRSMQSMVTKAILGKEYNSLKGFHSGELTNRVFSDVDQPDMFI